MSAPVVRCYSGHRYAQEPQSFDHDGRRYGVVNVQSAQQVLDATTGRSALVFVVDANSVETGGEARFRLSYDEALDEWRVEAA